MTYSTEGERDRFISGLRDLAEFLESNPNVPAPSGGTTVYVFPPGSINEQRRAEVDVIASLVSVQASEFTPRHYVASRYFGLVEYRAVAIDRDPDDPDGE